MEFWRNESTLSFDPDKKAPARMTGFLDRMKTDHMVNRAEALEKFLKIMTVYFDSHMASSITPDHLLLQEYFLNANVVDIRFIVKGMEKKILNTIVGGGFRLRIEFDDILIRAELSAYYHRLVCTNGMIRKTEATGRFETFSLEEWLKQVETKLPLIMSGISVGLDTFYRSGQIRLGFLFPVIPVLLEYMEIKQPYCGLIIESFEKEPGDTLWHLINAFSRAANLVMKASGVPPDEATQKRIRLQKASVSICEDVLENFEQGKSIFDIAESIKKISL
jgi:hypothetical protein